MLLGDTADKVALLQVPLKEVQIGQFKFSKIAKTSQKQHYSVQLLFSANYLIHINRGLLIPSKKLLRFAMEDWWIICLIFNTILKLFILSQIRVPCLLSDMVTG